ncbi:MAG TPA: exonuclease SbcCD subunit D [Anaerolineaceae bacterium]|nr:exonuclease SbcCD subunit D [Anaerolineaceae bacterium]
MLRILHFSDAHIDIANRGRRDPETGLPLRILDFLKALDYIIDTAIAERVDLVLFAGDAYKDRSPAPTFQREWDRRIVRLSQAGIPTVLLVGNHDLSPATGRAHAMQEFDTLAIPHVHVIGRPTLLKPQDLGGLPLQVLALPWVSRSSFMANQELSGTNMAEIYQQLEQRIHDLLQTWLDEADPELPVVLTAHTSVQGAMYGGERSVMLGNDIVLPGSLVKNPRFDYVALGHIHKAQNLNEGSHPPVIYPGSIERVDFGEARDEKYFVIAEIERGKTRVEWRLIPGRRFIDCTIRLTQLSGLETENQPAVVGDWTNPNGNEHDQTEQALPSPEALLARLIAGLPDGEEMQKAIVRLTVEYPRAWDSLIDEAAIRRHTDAAFEFHLIRRPQMQSRMRIPGDQTLSSLTPMDLLEQYWQTIQADPAEAKEINRLAQEIITTVSQPAGPNELKEE